MESPRRNRRTARACAAVGREVRNRHSRASSLVIRVLVTGARGFIGSAIVRRLERDGYEIIPLKGDLLAGTPDLSDVDATHCIHAAWYTNHADYLIHEINREWAAASLRLAQAFPGRFLGLGTCLEYDVANVDEPCVEHRTPLRP